MPLALGKNLGLRAERSATKRAKLSSGEAAEIFKLRIEGDCESLSAMTAKSNKIASMFNVSPKAVRDIWNQRTWRHATVGIGGNTDFLQNFSAAGSRTGQTMISKSRKRNRNEDPERTKSDENACFHKTSSAFFVDSGRASQFEGRDFGYASRCVQGSSHCPQESADHGFSLSRTYPFFLDCSQLENFEETPMSCLD
mmetsp:Transcript_18120/g.50028  ORF Transcript_18120/g.50028 Transcript_18120/m.50028 type:complete len:197 (-) Transcript_18120:971-1561(-)